MRTVRALTADDVDAVIELEATVFASENPGETMSTRIRNQRIMPWFIKLDQEVVFGAFKDGQLVCFIIAQDENPGGESSYIISAVNTHPDYRRQGHARAVMHEVLHAVHERAPNILPHLHVDRSNEAAQRLYETFGFEANPDSGYETDGVSFMVMVQRKPGLMLNT